jgi:hypothetical protein
MHAYTLAENVPVDGIDDRYSLEFCVPEKGEIGPIEEFGVLFPPVIVSEKGRLSVVLGGKYLDDCRSSGRALPFALRIEKGETDERDFLLYLVLLKNELKGFNVVERSMAMKRFCDLAPGENPQACIPPAVLTLFGVGRNERLIRSHLSLAESSPYLRLSVLRRDLHEFTAFEIFRFRKDEWDTLAGFIVKLFMGTKKRGEIVSMMHDISERDRVSAAELVADPELARLIALPVDPPHVAERVYRHFERLRYPLIVGYRERFLEKLKALRIEKRFRFHVPRDFETWEFSLEIPFSSVEEFQRHVEKLQELGGRKSFRELMALRNEE